MQEAATRYLAVLAFTGLNSESHESLKADVKNDCVRNNMNSLPQTYERLMEMAGGYETQDRSSQDPRGVGMALINTAGQGRGDPGSGGRGDCAGRGGRRDLAIKKRRARTRTNPTSKKGSSQM